MNVPIQFIGLAPDQLASLMASLLLSSDPALTPEAAVDKAFDIVAESNIQHNANTLLKKIGERDPNFIAEQQAKAKARQKGIMVLDGPIPDELLKRNRQTQ